MINRVLRKIFIIVIVFVGIFAFSINNKIYAYDGAFEDNLYLLSSYNNDLPSLNDNFSDNKVIVSLKPGYGGLNKEINTNLFMDANIIMTNDTMNINDSEKIIVSSIEDLTYLNNPSDFDNNEAFIQILSFTLREKGKQNVINLIQELEQLECVLSAEPDYIYETSSLTLSDSFIDEQWGLFESGIDVSKAWELADTSNSNRFINVGIFESSMQLDHPDLMTIEGNFTPNIYASADHGTHVAGIIGAIGDNEIGVSGIVPVNVALLDTSTFVESLVWAIDNDIRVVNASFAYIDSMTGEYVGPDDSHISAIHDFGLDGGILICASGNDNFDTDENPVYPAGYANSRKFPNINNVISVGSLNENKEKSNFSNYGLNSVGLYAPGENILSTYPIHYCTDLSYVFSDGTFACSLNRNLSMQIIDFINYYDLSWEYIDEHFSEIVTDEDGNPLTPTQCASTQHHFNGYHYMNGTSMAAPHVTGVAALLLSLNEDLTAVQLKQAILESADTLSITVPNTNHGTTVGDTINQNVLKLNAYNAVKYVLENYMNSTTYILSNYSSIVNTNKVITSDASYFDELNGFYKLNVTCAKNYEFISSSTNGIEVILYDEDFNEISYNDLDLASNKVRFIENLSRGTYYLRVAYANEESTGTISTIIKNPCQGCSSLYRERVTLNCQAEPYEDSLYLQQNQTMIYELDLECNTRYDFEVESPNLLSVGLYDENMTLVADFLYFQETNNNYYYFNVQDLEEGIYHIKIELASDSSDCDIQVTLDHSLVSLEEILVNQPVDVLEHLHYNQNSYYFMQNKPGIYEVVLTGTSSNGTLVYPEGAITIVSGDNVVQKYVFTKGDYNNPATSLFGSNTMTWLVDDYASYYINIDINSTGLTSLQLEVRELETFSLSASDEYNKSSSLINGDKFEILNVERTGEYNVKATYTGNQVENMLFVILRKNSEGLFEEIDGGLVNNTSFFETNVILNTYEQIYIGYFNGKGSGTFSLNIDRNVSNTFSLMTDPNSNVIVGSEVSLNNGVYGGTTLTQGYTRIVYLGMDAPYIESRTQYNWYTTDSSVAIVSSFGTVTATATWTGSETYKTVTIRAVYKNNITVVGEIELTIYKDPNANSTTKKILQYYGMDVRGDGTTGTEVSQNGGSKIDIGYMPEVTITKGYTRYICLGTDSPSNIIQHFTWSVSRQNGETGNASVSQYGTITAISEGYIIIKGVYKYNPQYEIYITIKVV